MPAEFTGSADRFVAEVVAQLLDLESDELPADTALAGIEGWDSVNRMRVLVYLERRLAVPLDFDRFMAAASLAELSAVVADVTERAS